MVENSKMSIEELERMAVEVRTDIIEMIHEANAGHPGGSLSAADILTALYFRIMNVDPQCPDWPDRDRFILSKGHACPVWYAALAERGYYDKSHLKTLRKLNSILQGHADMIKTPGVDMTVGSLGQGISAGLGMALSGKLRKKDYHVWVVIGDGECQEGSVWEAAMAASKWKLDNYTLILDYNGIQNDTFTDDVMPLGAITDKWRAFGWNTIEIDGHNMQEIVEALEEALTIKGQPTIIIAKTIKGKGVSFMENVPVWHGKAPDDEQAETRVLEPGPGLQVLRGRPVAFLGGNGRDADDEQQGPELQDNRPHPTSALGAPPGRRPGQAAGAAGPRGGHAPGPGRGCGVAGRRPPAPLGHHRRRRVAVAVARGHR